ncbi:RADS2 nonreducing polyketide synthase [Colletotrichum tabaci]|uniref:RADS2 nonreducing polyketide synthase n=1 Tax=Colletotrichum tabaci TaxID=1209068 RepID=A0AAV9TMG9_9PEZI
MAETLRKACLEPRDISYVEMHGTGTRVGDVAETTAVANVFGDAGRTIPFSVGTIKANIGHAGAIRAAFAVESIAQLVDELKADLREATTTNLVQGASSSGSSAGRISFVFTGQGSLYGGMGSDLCETSPVFRDSVDLCVRLARSMGFPPFLDLILDHSLKPSTKTTTQAQLATVTVQVALAAFWAACGIKPAMVMGHSLGEYYALYVAGVLSLSDILFLVGQRAALIQDCPEVGAYAMLDIAASEKTVNQLISARPRSSCQVACLNSPSATGVSGLVRDIKELQQHVRTQNLRTPLLPVAYGFHSARLDPTLAQYETIANGVRFSAPEIPVASTLRGSLSLPGDAARPWVPRDTVSAQLLPDFDSNQAAFGGFFDSRTCQPSREDYRSHR